MYVVAAELATPADGNNAETVTETSAPAPDSVLSAVTVLDQPSLLQPAAGTVAPTTVHPNTETADAEPPAVFLVAPRPTNAPTVLAYKGSLCVVGIGITVEGVSTVAFLDPVPCALVACLYGGQAGCTPAGVGQRQEV